MSRHRDPIQTSLGFNLIGLKCGGIRAVETWLSQHFSENYYLSNELLRKAEEPEIFPANFAPSFAFPSKRLVVTDPKLNFTIEEYTDEKLVRIKNIRSNYNRGNDPTMVDILVLPDPLNLLANRFRIQSTPTQNTRLSGNYLRLAILWKRYAREFLGCTHHLNKQVIKININEFFDNSSYRSDLLEALNIYLKLIGREFSSASESMLDIKLLKAKTIVGGTPIEISRFVEDECRFDQIISDTNLMALSDKIFGTIVPAEYSKRFLKLAKAASNDPSQVLNLESTSKNTIGHTSGTVIDSRRIAPSSDLEIRFVGLRRSGNHAIINWIAGLAGGSVCFLNDVSRKRIDKCDPGNQLPGIRHNLWNSVPLNHPEKDLVIYSFEDEPLAKINELSPVSNIIGKSKRRIDVLLLRDPYNLFSSRLKLRLERPNNKFSHALFELNPSQTPELVAMWMQYAHEYMQLSNHLDREIVTVNYNRWFADECYRIHLAKRLGLSFNDHALLQVSRYGFGSSFDGLTLQNNGQGMDVLKRWNNFLDDPLFQKMIDDPDLRSLSEKIFGQIGDF